MSIRHIQNTESVCFQLDLNKVKLNKVKDEIPHWFTFASEVKLGKFYGIKELINDLFQKLYPGHKCFVTVIIFRN